jgi:hypothetical protein
VTRRFAAVLVACVGWVAAGCADGSVAVSGTVTRGGKPLTAGYVTLEPDPAAGTTGTGATAPVENGTFSFPAGRLRPGKYVVRVGPPLLGSGMTVGPDSTFPPWTTTAEVSPGGPPLSFDVPPAK